MSLRNVIAFDEQTGLTTTSANFIVNPLREVSVVCALTAGSPATGACVQVTLDEVDKIEADTATWVNSPLGNRVTSGAENILRPITGVRLSVTDGTWSFQVRQA